MARKAAGGTGDAKSSRRRGSRSVIGLVRVVGLLLAGGVVVRELRRPRTERTWHGTLAGVVPYDLRKPTMARARERMWAPDDPRIVMPRVFGVGWTLILGRLVRLVRSGSPASSRSNRSPASSANSVPRVT
jgi:hypothetical protein